jgi:DNA-binding GntR family transcriptional regulator
MQMKAKSVTPARLAVYNAQHEEVVGAIRARDTSEAAQSMQKHLRAVREAMLPFL